MAETSGLLNRRTGDSRTEGSNPSVSATARSPTLATIRTIGYMSFLTCEPNSVVGAVHSKAMRVMLDQCVFNRWPDDERVSACHLAVPYPDVKVMVLA